MKKKSRQTKFKKPIPTQIKLAFQKFKKQIELKLGQINWNKVSVFAMGLLLFVATQGLLGPKAQIIAHTIVAFAT